MIAHLPVGGGSDHEQVKSEEELARENTWSAEHDCLPLKQRLKMLLSKGVSASQERISVSDVPPIVVKKEDDDQSDSLCFQSSHQTTELRSDSASCEQSEHGMGSAVESSSLQDRSPSEYPKKVEAKSDGSDFIAQSGSCQNACISGNIQEIIKIIEMPDDFLDGLDHIVLKERQTMLLSRKSEGSIKPTIKHNLSNSATTVDGMILQNAGTGRAESDVGCKRSASGGDDTFAEHNGNASACGDALVSRSLNDMLPGVPTMIHQSPTLASHFHETTSIESENFKNVHGEGTLCSSKETASNKSLLSSNCDRAPALALQPFMNVKVEPLDSELQSSDKDAMVNSCLGNLISVKTEHVSSAEAFEDIIDHMLLGERMKLMASREFPKSDFYENLENSRKFVPSTLDYFPSLSESSKPLRMRRPRKRRKTVTNSIETALEEDAPGLLQVLIEKGVLVDEIKLYGETEDDEALDESLVEESFSELEAVISKIFSQRQSFLKLAPIRCSKGEKASYCLACIISLVEQARYLRLRKWPVEWGWCRDLQSFIFVFERHNRIVLERPEYGYATYFFELVDTLPVHWQIKRLVTAMKLTSCSRITLIENRALMVGDDLTEGEAKVLMEYGWIPDTGLGTMLNYCDRVVHDRKHEKDSSEWRSKIGKLLMDGYNGGIIVPNDIPKKLAEFGVVHSPQIKLEQ